MLSSMSTDPVATPMHQGHDDQMTGLLVVIILGSARDAGHARAMATTLEQYGVPYEVARGVRAQVPGAFTATPGRLCGHR